MAHALLDGIPSRANVPAGVVTVLPGAPGLGERWPALATGAVAGPICCDALGRGAPSPGDLLAGIVTGLIWMGAEGTRWH